MTSKKPLIKVTAIEYCINNAPPTADSEEEDEQVRTAKETSRDSKAMGLVNKPRIFNTL